MDTGGGHLDLAMPGRSWRRPSSAVRAAALSPWPAALACRALEEVLRAAEARDANLDSRIPSAHDCIDDLPRSQQRAAPWQQRRLVCQVLPALPLLEREGVQQLEVCREAPGSLEEL
eukprot:CAMPEP_0177398400 /NCGR_PEP_ID=MMETSP0368-20130122/57880_1 /TAXON_ID=447022 ORGANISM="Scrippsiella hangoei-like, Strain SHHI-4" /NCGR_SAMPLE_ID=MMETSP0368 /ASSEMBLY_ACC=CAM_ASM_000363 /LENGTH=116 /DNA_ID=CAMNT_0018865479 /DNA_START=118 /DNA_END=466 /DNA_ORIENTATION=+